MVQNSFAVIDGNTLDVHRAIQDQIAEEVRAEIARRKESVKELSAQLDIPLQPLYKMTQGLQEFNPQYLEKLRSHFGKPAFWPYQWSVQEERADYNAPLVPLTNIDPEGGDVKVPFQFAGRGWIGFVQPDSSNMPRIHPGDVLTVLTGVSKIRFDAMHIVQVPDTGELLARVIRHQDGIDVLVPLNPRLPIEPVAHNLVGLVTGWFHDDDPGFDTRINPTGLKWY